MFRVDPAYQRLRLVQPSGGPLDLQDHDFLELTSERTIWVLQVCSVQELGEARPWHHYFFYELPAALQIAASRMWINRVLHVMQPKTRSLSYARMPSSRVLEIWECREPNGRGTCYQVTTDKGVHLVSACGTRLGRETKVQVVWETPRKSFNPPRARRTSRNRAVVGDQQG